MELPRLSIIVVSRQRRELLARCLAALSQQDHRGIEVIVVADAASLDVRPDLAVKRIGFDQANIAMARNLGLAAAAADIVAFIDDDALALPSWASRLATAFADPRVIAATGFTRGPDGLRWQVQAERITPLGTTVPIRVGAATALPVEQGCPVSTIGTNCAFRRDALARIGGFDPAFPYYLDESDVNMRLAAHLPQGLTAVVPGAEVVHGIAAGPMRGWSGVPRDLTMLGRSAIRFARRHSGCAGQPLKDLALQVEEKQRRRLLRHMVAGRLDPFAVPALMRGLRRGMAEGEALPLPPPPPSLPVSSGSVAARDAADPARAFLPLHPEATGGTVGPSDPLILCGWLWRARDLRLAAAGAVRRGRLVCLLLLTPTILPHRLTLAPGGWWEQRGGLWAFADLPPIEVGAGGQPLGGRPWANIRRRGAETLFAQAMLGRFSPFTKM